MKLENDMWVFREPRKWNVEKRERRICFGYPGYIEEWISVDSFDELKDAQLALDRLSSLDPLIKYRIKKNEKEFLVLK